METFLGWDKPPRDCSQDLDVGDETSESEVLNLPMFMKLPSVLIKFCYFNGHKNNVRARLYLLRSRVILRVGEITSFLKFSHAFFFICTKKKRFETGTGVLFAKMTLSSMKERILLGVRLSLSALRLL